MTATSGKEFQLQDSLPTVLAAFYKLVLGNNINYSRGKTPSQHQLASRPCLRPLELVSSKILSRDSIRVNGVDIILRSKTSLPACSFLNTIEIALIKSQSSEFSSGYPWVPQQYFCFVDLNRQCVFPSISSWTNKPGNKEMTQECCSLRLVAERKEETSFEKWWGGGEHQYPGTYGCSSSKSCVGCYLLGPFRLPGQLPGIERKTKMLIICPNSSNENE